MAEVQRREDAEHGEHQAYEPPRLRVLGTVPALTQGAHHGHHPDGVGFSFHLHSSA